jgi:ubiquinone/menaquinone biosynthesis C-methylase UbiE
VLEIGFGTGLAIEQAARLACRGRVSGVDLSDDMVRTAAAHNSRAIVEGRVELKSGDAAVLPYAIETFDKVFAINVVYFWQAPIVMLTEIRRVLKIGGSVGLYLVAKEDMERTAFCRTSHFSLLSGEDVATVLAKVGFREVRVETTKEKWRTGICVLGFK